MYNHILIPTDGSELSELAIRNGVAFAKSIGAKVSAITVFPTFHTFSLNPLVVTDTPEQYKIDCDAEAERRFAAIRDAAQKAGVPYEVMHIMHDHPYEAIINAANQKGCDLIFMASHGRRGVRALVPGSETVKVLTHSRIPTLVYR
jgi:nucleotide-binding universal stress UspA family protein